MIGIDAQFGTKAMDIVRRLYPICRSITGNGVRATLDVVGEIVPITVHEVPSGTQVLDWTVPDEWNIRDAFIADSRGVRVVDFKRSNLHVVNYSVPVNARMSFDELRAHLHTLPDRPDSVPYRTSYYDRSWGFCLSQHQLDALPPGPFDVVIDATLQPGSLTYAEAVIPGQTDDEVLISAHVCHPSLADDNLSGIALSALLAEALAGTTPRHTIRFLWAPGTIGTITWLARNRAHVDRIKHGLTLTCLGDGHPFTYKRTVSGDRTIDRVVPHVLTAMDLDHHVIDFFPYGYDERQHNSPGFRLPVGSLMRGRHGQFPEYHTSRDDLGFVSESNLAESFAVLSNVVDTIDRNDVFVNQAPYGEPQLGSRGLYAALGGTSLADAQLAMLWVLNLGDGAHSLLDIAERSAISFDTIAATAAVLEEHDLLVRARHAQPAPSPTITDHPSHLGHDR